MEDRRKVNDRYRSPVKEAIFIECICSPAVVAPKIDVFLFYQNATHVTSSFEHSV